MSSEGEMFIIGVYVDDIVLARKSNKRIEEVKKALAKQFDIKDMGKLHYFVGMKVIQNEETGEVWIGQPAYTESILQKFGMEKAKPVSAPVDTSVKLVKATEDEECVNQSFYVPVGSWKITIPVCWNETRHHVRSKQCSKV